MTRFFFSLAAALFLAVAPLAAESIPTKPIVLKEMSPKELVHQVKGAVVRIESMGIVVERAIQPTPEGADELTWSKTGTGFIISGGYIVTNEHVLAPKPGSTWKEQSIVGEFAFELPGTQALTDLKNQEVNPLRPLAGPGNFEGRNWTRRTAKLVLVGKDDKTDLAVLKLAPAAAANVSSVTDNAVRALLLEQHAVKFAAPGSYELGEEVVAIGFAKCIPGMPSVTRGIISGLNRSIGHWADMIQTDAGINPGNSGGPLFNMKGEVVGVNSCVMVDFKKIDEKTTLELKVDNIGYARSSRTSKAIVAKLIEDKKIERVALGIDLEAPFRDEVRKLRVAQGLIVTRVAKDSPADKAGIKEGDVLTHLNGEVIESEGDYQAALALVGKNGFRATCQRLPENEAKQVVNYLKGNGKLPVRLNLDGQKGNAVDLQEIAVEFVMK